MKSRRPTRPSWRTRKTLAPPPEPEDVRMTKARRLPLSGPGIVINVPLSLLPEYLQLHSLAPFSPAEIQDRKRQGLRKPDGVLLVKRIKKGTIS